MLRCDRVSGNSKGGVLMSVPSTMQPSHTSTFTSQDLPVDYCYIVLSIYR